MYIIPYGAPKVSVLSYIYLDLCTIYILTLVFVNMSFQREAVHKSFSHDADALSTALILNS